jgi:hypothetical protein
MQVLTQNFKMSLKRLQQPPYSHVENSNPNFREALISKVSGHSSVKAMRERGLAFEVLLPGKPKC